MKRLHLILLELHLRLLLTKAAIVTTVTAAYQAVRNNAIVSALVVKLQGLRHLVTLDVRPVLIKGLISVTTFRSHTKVVGVSLLVLVALFAVGGLAKVTTKVDDARAKAIVVQAIKETPPAPLAAPVTASSIPSLAGVTRVSELDPEGHTVLAATVPTASVVIDASGLTWHPIAGFTEHWTGSYRLAP